MSSFLWDKTGITINEKVICCSFCQLLWHQGVDSEPMTRLTGHLLAYVRFVWRKHGCWTLQIVWLALSSLLGENQCAIRLHACMPCASFAQAASSLFIYVALHTFRKYRCTDSLLPKVMIMYTVKYIPYMQIFFSLRCFQFIISY